MKPINKVSDEVALTWVIAVAIYDLTFEVFSIMTQLLLYVAKLSVELINLCLLSLS